MVDIVERQQDAIDLTDVNTYLDEGLVDSFLVSGCPGVDQCRNGVVDEIGDDTPPFQLPHPVGQCCHHATQYESHGFEHRCTVSMELTVSPGRLACHAHPGDDRNDLLGSVVHFTTGLPEEFTDDERIDRRVKQGLIVPA